VRLLVARTRPELQAALDPAREACRRIGLVPTMGALHAGHDALIGRTRTMSDVSVVSIFVNPTQFGADEDFGVYPRSFQADLDRCAAEGVDLVFAPDVRTMYPDGAGGVSVEPGPLGGVFEGVTRPTHFRGVLTVVAKLLHLVAPDVAAFGEKDYQQLVLVRQMVNSLQFDVEVLGVPIVRQADGLALSSRNSFLDDEDRRHALMLSRALTAGIDAAPRGVDAVLAAARDVLASAAGAVDYVALTDPDLGEPRLGQEARLLVAARVSTVRLIDNTSLRLGLPAGASSGEVVGP